MAAQAPAQRRVQQMGGAVVGAGGVAALCIDTLVQRLADRHLALHDLGGERMNPAKRLRRIANFAFEPLEGCQFSCVANLAAALSVEGRLVEDDLHFLARPGAIRFGAVFDDRQHNALALVAGIAGEFGRAMLLGKVEPQILASLVA